MRRARPLRLALAVTMALALPMTVNAAVVLWTLVGSPLTASLGVSTTFTLTATNEDPLHKIGCVEVSVTPNFRVDETAITSDVLWTIGDSDSHTKVTARSTTSTEALGLLQSVVFTVTATPLAAGAFSWSGTAYEDINCGGTALGGVSLAAIVVTAATPTPTPSPTPTPTPIVTPSPAPTATPTPTATPSPTRTPSPAPTSSPGQGVTPSATGSPAPNPTPIATGEPDRSEAPTTPAPTGAVTATGRSGGAATPGLGLGPEQLAGDQFIVSSKNVTIDAGLSATRFGIQPFLVLVVPAIFLSGPGLLLILAFAAQVTGALAWLPIVRRHMGERQPVRRVRFSRRSSRP